MRLFRLFAPDRPNKFLYLFVSLVLLLVLYPYFDGGTGGAVFFSIMFLIIPLAAVYAAAESRRHLIIAGLLCLPAQVTAIEFILGIDVTPGGPQTVAVTLIFYLYVAYVLLGGVLRTKEVTRDTLYGAASAYLLIGLTFAVAFMMIERLHPGSFHVASQHPDPELNLADFLYKSFVTLTTLGYGDITPITSKARSLAFLEATTGVLYLAFLIGRLVGLYARSDSNS